VAKAKLKKSGGSSKSSKTETNLPKIVEEEFGKYRIKAGRLSGNFVARAFPKIGSNRQGLMAEAAGASEEEAIEALKERLRKRDELRTAARRWEHRTGISVPSKEEYIEALRHSQLSAVQLAMLKAQAIAGESGMTHAALTSAAGYSSRATAVKVFARAGTVVADYLGVDYQAADEDNESDPTRVLGFPKDPDEETQPVWIMYEELRQAVWATL
jgi:hypothetical protein